MGRFLPSAYQNINARLFIGAFHPTCAVTTSGAHHSFPPHCNSPLMAGLPQYLIVIAQRHRTWFISYRSHIILFCYLHIAFLFEHCRLGRVVWVYCFYQHQACEVAIFDELMGRLAGFSEKPRINTLSWVLYECPIGEAPVSRKHQVLETTQDQR
ncbi:hypothetical protein B0H34DRAFT_214247 [Crassisporium funariophilum]|nr:hypothetical protein B0H34DRAFT_214247 [Crassisporium funariophilum]